MDMYNTFPTLDPNLTCDNINEGEEGGRLEDHSDDDGSVTDSPDK